MPRRLSDPNPLITISTCPAKHPRIEYCPVCAEPMDVVLTSKDVGICFRCKDKAGRLATRLSITQYLGAKCSVCDRKVDSIMDIACFDIHHKRPEDKTLEFGDNCETLSWSRKMAEISNCELTCAICHRRKHQADPHVRIIREAERMAADMLSKMYELAPRPDIDPT